MSRIGTDTATSIVQTDTLLLISEADSIVRACTGTNCNTSSDTQVAITEQLSALAQEQAAATQRFLSIPTSSVVGRNVYEAYLNLGAAVAATYNFQCGANTTSSTSCVTTSSTVQIAQTELETVLLQPAQSNGSHVLILSLLAALVVLSFFLFFAFFSVGVFEKAV